MLLCLCQQPGVTHLKIFPTRPVALRAYRPEPCRSRNTTRSFPAGQLKHTSLLSGPGKPEQSNFESTYDLVDPSTDPDIRPLVFALSTTASHKQLDLQRFAKKIYLEVINSCSHSKTDHGENRVCKGWHYCKAEFTVEESEKVSAVIIQAVQQEVYSQEMKCIQKPEKMPKTSPLRNVDPFIDTRPSQSWRPSSSFKS